jgi:hypothetical protein
MAFYTHDVANFHSSSFGSIKLNGRESLEALAYWGKCLRLCAAVEYFFVPQCHDCGKPQSAMI